MVRLFLFLGILLAALAGGEFLAGGLFLFSLIRYTGFELVVVGILLDGYTGAFYAIPYLSLYAFLLWLGVDALKQMLLLYTKNNAVIS